MTPDEPSFTFRGHLAEVADTFPQLDVWRELVKQVPIIDEGSPLAEDAEVFEWLSSSDLAWQALCGAQDHLKGFRVWLLKGELFPMATFSLLRGALVGGALASWILRPDESEVRVTRALIAADDWYSNHIQWGKTMADFAVNPQTHVEQIRHVEDRLAEVRALRVGRIPNWRRLKMTEVITEANAALWMHDKVRAALTKALWQAGSGDAHAFGWALLSRQHDVTPLGEGMGEFVSGPSDLDVANAYLCAYDFVAYGFHRYEELRQASP